LKSAILLPDARFPETHGDEQAVENRLRARRAAGNIDVDGHHAIDAADRRVRALAEHSAAAPACADGHYHPRIRGRIVGATKRDVHIARHRPGDQQYVGVPWAGNEVDPEALEIVERIGRGSNFQFTRVATAGVDLPYVER